ncbi:MAG: hypothetical protein PHO05_06475 [bacterium]|nr:hypothetical protein [bacterium]
MYSSINRKSWNRILADNENKWPSPLTVHLPIQPVYSPDFIHVDSALNVCRRRVYPSLSVHERHDWERISQTETMLIQFALDIPPFIPDFRCSQMMLAEGRYPIVQTDYFARNILYRFEYFCCPLEESKQSMLWICCSITNESNSPEEVNAWAKINFQKEGDLFEFHYIPFYWDNSKWLFCDKVGLQGDRILYQERSIGRVLPGNFACSWKDTVTFDDEDYNKKFDGNSPYFVTPPLRCKKMQDAMRFSLMLEPKCSETFSLVILTGYENISDKHLQAMAVSSAEICREQSLAHYKSYFTDNIAQLICKTEKWDKIFYTLQTSILQLLVRFPGKADLMPTQGGSSERFFVWVWEAVFMLMPMLQIGHFKPVREALDFIFKLQDAGYAPRGRFTTTGGSIGTTGPRWINTTGSALALAADYYLYSQDGAYLEQYLPKIIKASEWIVNQIKETRRLSLDGARPLTYGLMPFGCATDGDIGHIVSITDAYTFWGLNKSVALLEKLGHKQANTFRAELEQYKQDIAVAVCGLTQSSGFIERKIQTGDPEERFTDKFENICSAAHLGYCRAIDISSKSFQRYISYFEDNLVDDYFIGKMDRVIYYMGVGEWLWQDIYLQLGEWKKAFMAIMTNLKYGMTQDTYQVQERFSKVDPAFTPWQPNGSGSGRALDMIIKSFYFEHDHIATLLGGIPFTWLQENDFTSLSNLYNTRGKLSLEVDMIDNRKAELRMFSDMPKSLPAKVRFPEYFSVDLVSEGVIVLGDNYFSIASGCYKVWFVLSTSVE